MVFKRLFLPELFFLHIGNLSRTAGVVDGPEPVQNTKMPVNHVGMRA
jgi:hypothetical protein